MQLILNYKCKQCGMIIPTHAADRVQNATVGLHGTSFKRTTLKVDNHTLSLNRFATHECNGEEGLCELVGWKVKE